MATKKVTQTKNTETPIPPQNISGYNRESGKKTLYFVAVMLLLITTLTIVTLYLFSTA